MEYINTGKLQVYLNGICGGAGCDSCDCEMILYDEARLYVSGDNYIIVTVSDCDDNETIIESIKLDKVKKIKIK